jgi:hypothetical protein
MREGSISLQMRKRRFPGVQFLDKLTVNENQIRIFNVAKGNRDPKYFIENSQLDSQT